MESVISASAIVLVIRSRRSLFRSRPSTYLLLATLAIVVVTLILLFSPVAALFGFAPLNPWFLLALGGIMLLYILSAETVKRIFYQKSTL